jgi:hypothetical protein
MHGKSYSAGSINSHLHGIRVWISPSAECAGLVRVFPKRRIQLVIGVRVRTSILLVGRKPLTQKVRKAFPALHSSIHKHTIQERGRAPKIKSSYSNSESRMTSFRPTRNSTFWLPFMKDYLFRFLLFSAGFCSIPIS